MKKLAKVVSLIFHFHLLAPLAFILMLYKFPLSAQDLIVYGMISLLLIGIFPYLTLIYFMKHKMIDDYDITKRQQRYKLLFACSIFITLYLYISMKLSIPKIYKLNAMFTVIFVIIFGVTTRFWKISYHLSIIGWFIGVMTTLFGSNLIFILTLLLIAISTALSRIYLKKHTPAQVFFGFVLGLGIYKVLEILYLI